MDTSCYYEEHGAETALVEDLAPLALDGEVRRTSVLLSLLELQPGERVLDIGCGDGFLLQAMTPFGADLFGVDLADSRVTQALCRFSASGVSAELQQASATSLPYEDGALDAASCSEVLEHLPDPLAAVREAHRVLKAGGRYVVSVPNRELISWRRCVHCGCMTPSDGHLHRFDADSLRQLLIEGGFRVLEVRGTYPLINRRGIIGWLLRRLPPSTWLALDAFVGRKLGKGNWLVALAVRG